MFVLSTPEQSEALLQELCNIERDLYSQLGLHFRIMVRLLSTTPRRSLLGSFASAGHHKQHELPHVGGSG